MTTPQEWIEFHRFNTHLAILSESDVKVIQEDARKDCTSEIEGLKYKLASMQNKLDLFESIFKTNSSPV